MTLERLALVERYLGTETAEGEFTRAVKEQTKALHNYHASLTLEHMSADKRFEELQEKTNTMVQAAEQMLLALEISEHESEDDPYLDLGTAG